MHHLRMQSWAAERLAEDSSDMRRSEEDRLNMQRLAPLADHNPELWQDDGRIFFAFAHLSEIADHIKAGAFIDSQEKAIIGAAGKEGTDVQHLDLAVMYFGSSQPGSGAMDRELNKLRTEPGNADFFFGLAQRSQLDPNTPIFVLYGENLDYVRIQHDLDEDQSADFMKDYSIYGN